MKNNDFDFIKQKFDAADIEAPHELDSRVMSKLNNASPVRIPFVQTRAFKAGVSIAACIAIFVSVLTTLPVTDVEQKIKPNSTATQLDNFDSYDNVEKYIKEKEKEKEKEVTAPATIPERIKDKIVYGTTVKGEADVMINSSNNASNASANTAHTYVQEKGIDEADIIKTSGKDIYYLTQSYDEKSGNDVCTVNVFETNKGKSDLVNTIQVEDEFSYIQDMFVNEDRLVVNCVSYGSAPMLYENSEISAKKSADFMDNTVSTKSIVYDISDIEAPVEINSFEQTGAYASSRLIGDTFYIVSDFRINPQDVKNKEFIPAIRSGSQDSEKINANDIYYAKNGIGSDYVVVTALDVTTCETVGTTKAVLGCGDDIYCTNDYLYVYGSDINDRKENTTIAKISLKNGVKFTDYIKLDGYVDSQYSFSEKDNHLCVFTTSSKNNKPANYLYVLDKNLKQIYKSEAFATNETIKAVKYVDDFAYVITYREIDPLFVVDLSNVKKPSFMGSVEIEGFSSMLVHVGENLLLGIGYNTEIGEAGNEYASGVKLVLFDVSNGMSPKVLDSKVYKNFDSEAQYNPKAFVQNTEKGYYAIPVITSSGNSKKGALVFTVKDNKIVEKENFTVKTEDGYNTRVTYVDDYYYVLDSSLDVASFKLK